MNPMRMHALHGILKHLKGLQGGDLRALMMAKEKSETPAMEAKEGPVEEALENKMGLEPGKPKGISVEKVSIMGKPDGMPSDQASMDEPSPDEMEELYKPFHKKGMR